MSPKDSSAPPPLTETFADLLYRISRSTPGFVPDQHKPYHCDVLIIGSGYGGAVAASALGETIQPGAAQPRIWLLERGQHYLPGQFPGQMADLAGHVRFNTPRSPVTVGRRNGLFDIRVGEDAGVLVANGVGGGSLINAGVMAWPQDEVFQFAPWPEEIRQDRHALRQQSELMMRRLGATRPDGRDNTIQLQTERTSKFNTLDQIGRSAEASSFKAVPITVAMCDGDRSSDQVQLQRCLRCGDCATGCNHGAKISLDTNLLHQAARRGVKLFTGATVMCIEPLGQADEPDKGWRVMVNHTDEQMQWREGEAFALLARRVVLAAGSLGSTGILLRSRSDRFPLSHRLGKGFSGNGDLLMAAYRQNIEARAIADETVPPDVRNIGPTITGMIDRRQPAPSKANLHRGYVIQELAIPGPLQRLFEEVTLTARTIGDMGTLDCSHHHPDAPGTDPASIDPQAMRHTLPLAMIGHDDAQGRLKLVRHQSAHDKQNAVPDTTPHLASDAALTVTWPSLRHDRRFDRQIKELEDLCQTSGAGGTVLPNPLWKLPTDLIDRRGPLLIAHPLGGCGMGQDHHSGVVNHLGQVFNPHGPNADAVHYGLVVMDGAMIPSSLGINPALTIATLSERAITALLDRHWQDLGQRSAQPPTRPSQRPLLTPPAPPPPANTTIDITEQMRGWVGDVGVELTLRLKPVAVADLLRGFPFKRTLEVDPAHSRLRVIARPHRITHKSWDAHATTLLAGTLSGHLHALHRGESTPRSRIRKAIGAWWLNRGLRDITQGLVRLVSAQTDTQVNVLSLIGGLFRTASQAGEIRLIDYDLRLDEVTHQDGCWHGRTDLAGQVIQGHKRITYARKGNPWKQLTTMQLNRFPGLPMPPPKARMLTLNLAYLADIGIPLIRVTRQRDLPTTLADLAALGMLFTRMLARIHMWSLRPPDTPLFASCIPKPYGLLPGHIPRLPDPNLPSQNHPERIVTSAADEQRGVARIQLTHYASHAPGSEQIPIVLLHGYSASGTSFAHPALKPGLARYLWEKGRDVWIVDFRTSPGMKPDPDRKLPVDQESTATLPWTFEDVALQDIPIALAHIAERSPTGQVNVLAHCMGSAMLWMGLLAPDLRAIEQHPVALAAMRKLQGMDGPGLIHKLCMSQVNPIVHFSETNLLRAFVLRYVRQFLPLRPYHFTRPDKESLNDRLLSDAVDLLLATLPYPESEWDKENPNCPPWLTTPWARTRRRMDMLYGRTFNLKSMSSRVLMHIDDLFGPMNLNTLSQVLHIARAKAITDASGRCIYLDQQRVAQTMDRMAAMMSIHGEDNGLSDISGMYAFRRYVQSLGRSYSQKYKIVPIAGKGHQDCLIGEKLDRPGSVFPIIDGFF